MFAILRTAAVFGVEAYPGSVEVDVSDGGLPAMTMVGLPDASVRESRDRVQSAIRNSGFEFPRRHVTVNLSPADVRKVGAAFDLPIAVWVLAATGLIPTRQIEDAVVLGEFSLDGAVRPVRGALPTSARVCRDGVSCVILPHANAGEAALVAGLAVVPVTSLGETGDVLTGRRPRPTSPEPLPPATCTAGAVPRPGEISLAHTGVLLLDETAEFARHVLDGLRQPLEEGTIRTARVARTAVFPARFMLAATMNPCPCGFHGDDRTACRCSPQQIDRYRGRLSGPLRDRIDFSVWVPAVPFKSLAEIAPGEVSARVRRRVATARQRQTDRGPSGSVLLNARLEGRSLTSHCALDRDGLCVLDAASRRFHLSARSCDAHRCRKGNPPRQFSESALGGHSMSIGVLSDPFLMSRSAPYSARRSTTDANPSVAAP